MKKIILMDPYPAMGHLNSFINLAQWLTTAGYEIVFAVTSFSYAICSSNGFRCYSIEPLSIYRQEQDSKLLTIMSNLLKTRHKIAKKAFYDNRKLYEQMIHSIRPNYVFIDDHHGYKILFYPQLNIKVVSICTMIVPLKETSIPPIQSSHIPANTLASNLYIRILWSLNRVKNQIKSCYIWILYWGITDIYLFTKECAEKTVRFDRKRSFGIGINEMPLIATHPRSFNFKDQNSPVFYYGNLPTIEKSCTNNKRLQAVLNSLENDSRKKVYCSLGTVTANYKNVCHSFYNKIIAVAENSPNYIFIVNVGYHYNVSLLPITPANVYVFKEVPQLLVLTYVDIMINHGGLNSIKECISLGIPMIVYPLSLKWDQPGCAARVVYHRLGIAGNIRTDTTSRISKSINYLSTNINEYQQNIQNFKLNMKEINEEDAKKLLKWLSSDS